MGGVGGRVGEERGGVDGIEGRGSEEAFGLGESQEEGGDGEQVHHRETHQLRMQNQGFRRPYHLLLHNALFLMNPNSFNFDVHAAQIRFNHIIQLHSNHHYHYKSSYNDYALYIFKILIYT